MLIDPVQQFISLWEEQGCGSLVIKSLDLGSQSFLAAHTYGMQFSEVGFSAFRLHPAVHLLVWGRKLWRSHD
jgi:hypothetical protein